MEADFSLSQYLAVLRRHWRIVAITVGVVVAAAVVFTLRQPISYKATAVLTSQPPKYNWRLDPSFQTVIDDLRLDRRAEFSALIADARVSRNLASKVIEKLSDGLPEQLRVADELRRHVEVSNGRGRLVYLSAMAPTAELAEKLANSWAEVWIAETDAQFGQGTDEAKFVEELQRAQQSLDAANAALQEFRTRSGLAMELGGDLTALGDGTLAAGMSLLHQQLVLNNSQLAEYRSTLARVDMLRDRVVAAQVSGASFDTLPLELLDAPLLIARKQLNRERVDAMNGDLAQLLSALDREKAALASTLSRLESETGALQTQLAELIKEQDQLELDQRLATETARALQQKVTEIVIQRRVAGTPLVLLEPAELPGAKAAPNWLLNLGGAVLIGLLAGIMLAFWADYARKDA